MAFSSLDEETAKKVLRQVEFYFSDSNLPRDKFLKKLVTESKDGMVSLAVICSFSRMRNYLGLGDSKASDVPGNIIKAAAETLRNSDFLKVSEDGRKIGRVSKLSKPEEVIEQVDIRTIAASPLEYDAKIEDVESFFGHYGKVNSVRLPRHISDKRCFCGTALIEFSAEEDAEKVLKQNLVYSGAMLELKPKKVFDAERKKVTEDFEKSCSSTGSNHKNNAKTNANYPKGLIVSFTLKRRSIGRAVEHNRKSDPASNNRGISRAEREQKSKENIIDENELKVSEDIDGEERSVVNVEETCKRIEESEYKISVDVVEGEENPVKIIEKENYENIEVTITKESEDKDSKDSENAIRETGKKSPEVVCQESMEKAAVGEKSAAAVNKEKDSVLHQDLKDVFERFGTVKYVDYTMGADSGYIRFEESEASQKARATAVFVKEGGLIVKNFIASLEAVTGEAEGEYWKQLRGNQERFRESRGGRARGGKSNRDGRDSEAKRSHSKENDSAVQRSSKVQKVEAV